MRALVSHVSVFYAYTCLSQSSTHLVRLVEVQDKVTELRTATAHLSKLLRARGDAMYAQFAKLGSSRHDESSEKRGAELGLPHDWRLRWSRCPAERRGRSLPSLLLQLLMVSLCSSASIVVIVVVLVAVECLAVHALWRVPARRVVGECL